MSNDFYRILTKFLIGAINNYNDPNQVRNCWLVGLPDLKVNTEYVRTQIVNYMNDLIGIGVAGFRIDGKWSK